MEQNAATVAQHHQQLSPKPVHAIRYLHGARALRATLAETHGGSRAVAATSLLTSLLLTCDAMPGVMNRLRRGGWVKFWTSQIVALSDQSESTQRRARSILRDAGVLEERRLTSGEISMRIDLELLLAATPAIVGAPDDDVTVQEPKPSSGKLQGPRPHWTTSAPTELLNSRLFRLRVLVHLRACARRSVDPKPRRTT